jgi:hypothetical protein
VAWATVTGARTYQTNANGTAIFDPIQGVFPRHTRAVTN